jgi:hypothetical protein
MLTSVLVMQRHDAVGGDGDAGELRLGEGMASQPRGWPRFVVDFYNGNRD